MMDRVATDSRSEFKLNEDGGFKFAITLITACIGILFIIFNYAENNQVSFSIAVMSWLFTYLSIIPFLYMLVYIFLRAVSLEISTNEDKISLQKSASKYYLNAYRVVFNLIILPVAFVLFAIFYSVDSLHFLITGAIILFCVSLYITIFRSNLNNQRKKLLCIVIIVIILTSLLFTAASVQSKAKLSDYSFALILSSSVTFIIVLLISLSQHDDLKPLKISPLKTSKRFLYPVVICSLLIQPYLLSGHIIAGMNSIYYKQDKQIPVDVSVTGYRPDEVVFRLYNVNFQSNLVLIDSINTKLNSSINDEFPEANKSTYLCINELNNGKYRLFINCSNLPVGYYDLFIATRSNIANQSPMDSYIQNLERYLYGNKTVINSFYLLETNRTT
jgi:hypothetical protein